MGTYAKISATAFEEMQLDAGVLLSTFTPSAPTVTDSNIICATSGGINITCIPTFQDMGEDVDNCPVNVKEYKRITGYECKMSFKALDTSLAMISKAIGAATTTSSDKKVTPDMELASGDFSDVWWVGDRADGGFVAVKLLNALSTSGFNLQTSKDGKGNLSVELTGHFSASALTTVPIEIYSYEGT